MVANTSGKAPAVDRQQRIVTIPTGSARWPMGQRVAPTDNEHPCEADLTAFAVGRLTGLRVVLIERHVNRCERCAALVARSPGDEFVNLLRHAQKARQGDAQTRSWHKSPLGDHDGRADASLANPPAELHRHPRYECLRLLAEGGMGAVYLARHRVTGSLVAVKTIRPHLAASDQTIDRFLREAKIAGKLNHPNIARVLDAEQLDTTAILVMDHAPGKTLAQLVAAKGPLPVEEACHYVRQIALGLQHAHEQGVVHRDIKPQNVMVLPAGGVRILDFGLGRLVDEQRTRFRLTKDDQVLGTPDYMAPEQSRDAKSADTRSDIYALGGSFYFLLAGEPPFAGASAVEVLTRREQQPPPDVRSLRPDVPRELSDLIARMLAKDPQVRPQQPSEIVELLSNHIAPATAHDAAASPSGSWRIRRYLPSSGESLLDAIVAFMLSPAFVLPLATALVCLLLLILM